MRIGVTGHKRSKMVKYGFRYEINSNSWVELQRYFMTVLIANKCDEAVTGMDLGVDTIFALAVCKLKEAGYKIKLHCAIPFIGHDSKWLRQSDRDMYLSILEACDCITVVDTGETEKRKVLAKIKEYRLSGVDTYINEVAQNKVDKTNEFIVNNIDKMIAVWTGESGGTEDCVKYALKNNIPTVVIKP